MIAQFSRRSWGGTRDKPNNVCVGGYQNIGLDELFPETNTSGTIRFLYFADGDKIGLAALTSVSRAPHNALFELRLKIDKTVDLAMNIFMKRTHMHEQSEMLFVPFHLKLNFWAIFVFFNISLISAYKK